MGEICLYKVDRVMPSSLQRSPTLVRGYPWSHREPQLSWRHLGPAASLSTPSACGGKPCAGALGNQIALELGERGEYAEDQLACRRSCVDRRTLTSQNPQTHPSACKVMHDVDEVPQIAAKAIELPDDQRVALPKRLQARSESGPVVSFPEAVSL